MESVLALATESINSVLLHRLGLGYCIESDWGIGILSKQRSIGSHGNVTNQFYEFSDLHDHRKAHLNLISFDALKELLA